MSLWNEMRRRSVVKVGVTYGILAWLLVQVASLVFPQLGLPAWAPTLVTVLLIIGFPVALLLAWAYEMTPDGIKPIRSVRVGESLTNIRGQRLNIWMTGVLGLAVAFMAADNYLFRNQGQAEAVPAFTEDRLESLQFIIDAPRGSQFALAQMSPHPALSPDGQQLAFVAPPRSDNPNESADDVLSVLWLQRVGDLTARQLPGTEGAMFPFWSPDGRYVAYGSSGPDGLSLNRFSVTGAAPTLITQIDGYYGGAWSTDGTIIYSGATGILSVSPEGGVITQVTRIAADEAANSHRFPALLQDGSRFVYLIVHSNPERDGLYIGAMEDAPENRRRLTESDSNGMLATGPDGRTYLLYVQNYSLVARAFDTQRAEFAGEARLVAGGLEPGAGGRLAPFTASGRNLIYRPRYQPQTRLTWFNRSGGTDDTIELNGAIFAFPSLSHDGSKLAVVRELETSQSIWWFDLNRGISERLTPEGDIYTMPAWSNNDDHIFYTRFVDGSGYEIYSQRLSARQDQTPIIVGQVGLKYLRDTTRDGRYVIFQGLNSDIWAAPTNGTGSAFPVLQSSAIENHARVSPDGNWIAYSATVPGGGSEIYVTSFPSPGEQPIRVSLDGGADPHWRADGGELFYVARNDMLMSVGISAGDSISIGLPEQMFRINPEPWSLRYGSVYSPSPDGERFMVSEMIGNNAVQLLAVLGWNFQQ